MPVYFTWACPVFVPNIAQPLLSGLDTGSVPSIKSHIRKNRVGGQTAGASKCRTLVGRVQHSAPRPTSLSMPSAIGISNRSCKADRTAPDCSPPAILTLPANAKDAAVDAMQAGRSNRTAPQGLASGKRDRIVQIGSATRQVSERRSTPGLPTGFRCDFNYRMKRA